MDVTPEQSGLDLQVSHDLAELLVRYPLPPGVPDVAMNQAELATTLQVSTNTVGKWAQRSLLCSEWRDDPSPFLPVTEVGGQGRAYVFRLSHVYAWQAHRRDLDAARSNAVRHAQTALQASFLGLDPIDASTETLDPKMRRALALSSTSST